MVLPCSAVKGKSRWRHYPGPNKGYGNGRHLLGRTQAKPSAVAASLVKMRLSTQCKTSGT